jgi:hypothetical protein
LQLWATDTINLNVIRLLFRYVILFCIFLIKEQSIVSSEEGETNGEPNNNNKRKKVKQRKLTEVSETFTSEDVAAGKMKNSAKIPMSRISTARTPRKLFNSRELTDASLGQINLENK